MSVPESAREGVTRVSLQALPVDPEATGKECLVVLYGGSLGRKFDLGTEDVLIGRDGGNDIVLPVDSVSRVHALIRLREGRREVMDRGSTNGTYCNDTLVQTQALNSGDLLRLGDVIFKYLAGHDVEAAYHEEIYRMTISDGLTRIANVRYLNEFLEREFARSRRYGRDLCLLLLDIDHFKQINDTMGHLAGDAVLRDLAGLIDRRVRREELLARYGGEEFALVLPETDGEGALAYAEMLRKMVEEHVFTFEGETIQVTVSVGIGSFEPNMGRPSDLIRHADEKLYEAKNAGRNCVVS